MAHLTKNYPIKARDYLRAGEVSMQVQGLLKSIGFGQEVIRRVSICAYEAEMNVVMHGGDGQLTIEINTDAIIVDIKDDGPGIEDIDLALQEGYSTASEEAREMGFGAGMGLPNIQKNSDSLEIVSGKGRGAQVKIGFKA
jgi:anti-sigma regulatory factor (Ser/Thr protein kinase)